MNQRDALDALAILTDGFTVYYQETHGQMMDIIQAFVDVETPTDTPPLTTYWQQDPRWKDTKLGTGNTTIGRYGCVLCCMTAAAERAAHEALTPPQANILVGAYNGFTGENGNRFRWATGGKALGLKFEWREYWSYGVPADVGRVIASVEAGHYVLLKVDFDPQDAHVTQHWVLVREHIGGDIFLIDDPWTGETHKLPPAYSRGGWTAKNALFGAVAFSGDGE